MHVANLIESFIVFAGWEVSRIVVFRDTGSSMPVFRQVGHIVISW